jgi:hypothetical protein
VILCRQARVPVSDPIFFSPEGTAPSQHRGFTEKRASPNGFVRWPTPGVPATVRFFSVVSISPSAVKCGCHHDDIVPGLRNGGLCSRWEMAVSSERRNRIPAASRPPGLYSRTSLIETRFVIMKQPGADSYGAREKRVFDTIGLRKTDRVPATASFCFFPAHYYGYTVEQMMYDMDVPVEGHARAKKEFRLDLARRPVGLLHLGAPPRCSRLPADAMGRTVFVDAGTEERGGHVDLRRIQRNCRERVRRGSPRMAGSMGVSCLTGYNDWRPVVLGRDLDVIRSRSST